MNTFDRVEFKFSRYLFLGFFLIECSLAYYERYYGVLVFPYSRQDSEIRYSWMFRSRSLYGDPLNNAMMVLTIMTYLALTKLDIKMKILLLFVGYFSLFCFNARAAIVVSTVFVLPIGVLELARKKNMFFAKILILLVVFGVVLVGSNLALNTDLGGRIIKMDLLDGSAMTRLDVFNFYEFVTPKDLIVGNPINTEMLKYKLNAAGIENGFVAYVVYFGVLFSVPVVLFLVLMVVNINKYVHLRIRVYFVSVFFIIGLTNPNLIHVEQWAVLIICMFLLEENSHFLLFERGRSSRLY